jgi:hypothetical protein
MSNVYVSKQDDVIGAKSFMMSSEYIYPAIKNNIAILHHFCALNSLNSEQN